jgi:predicted phosphoadenosine phosphosulfate sulfurtransferase
MKKYTNKNVLQAFNERMALIFPEFEHIYISLSGGKDSSVTIQLANEVAKKLNRTYDVMFIDYEAQYQYTIDHIYELKKLSNIGKFYHIALPFKAANSCSVFNRFWYPWNEAFKKDWTRPLPEDAITQHNHPFGNLYNPDLMLRGVFNMFAEWYKLYHNTNKVANIQGIRTDESMNRFRAVAFGVNMYNGIKWSTDNSNGVFSFYPLYDWRTEDVWAAVSKFNLSFNLAYEQLFKMGISIHDQRIAQPYGFRQMNGLAQWAAVEPSSWEKVVNRVSGANFANIYAKTTLLGHNGTTKPDHMSWEQYLVFLLETLGLYSPALMLHYYRKIRIYLDHYIEEGRIKSIDEIPEEIDKQTVIAEKGRENGRWIQWRRIAKCIEKNDFTLTGCNYGTTIQDKKDMQALKDKWGKLLGLEHYQTKEMKKLANEIGYETN